MRNETNASGSRAPGRAALKIPLPPSPYGPASADLGVLVSAAIKARPSCRRDQDDFHPLTDLTNNPIAPPSTPVDTAILTPGGWSLTPEDAHKYNMEGVTPIELANSNSTSPRTSSETKRVTFLDYWEDNEGGVGLTRGDSHGYRIND